MILQITQLPEVLRQSKSEAVIFDQTFFYIETFTLILMFLLKFAWIVTFLSVIILDVDIGLYIGVLVTLMLCIFRAQR